MSINGLRYSLYKHTKQTCTGDGKFLANDDNAHCRICIRVRRATGYRLACTSTFIGNKQTEKKLKSYRTLGTSGLFLSSVIFECLSVFDHLLFHSVITKVSCRCVCTRLAETTSNKIRITLVPNLKMKRRRKINYILSI